jgi:hypothetical protein
MFSSLSMSHTSFLFNCRYHPNATADKLSSAKGMRACKDFALSDSRWLWVAVRVVVLVMTMMMVIIIIIIIIIVVVVVIIIIIISTPYRYFRYIWTALRERARVFDWATVHTSCTTTPFPVQMRYIQVQALTETKSMFGAKVEACEYVHVTVSKPAHNNFAIVLFS